MVEKRVENAWSKEGARMDLAYFWWLVVMIGTVLTTLTIRVWLCSRSCGCANERLMSNMMSVR